MPERDIAGQLGNMTLEKAAMLKPHWRVAMAALFRRSFDTGCITERQYRFLFTKLGATGQRMAEPLPLPAEKPQVVAQLVSMHRGAFGYNDTDLRKLLFSDDPQFLGDGELPLPTITRRPDDPIPMFSRPPPPGEQERM